MTITTATPTYVQLPGNGTATTFAFPFKVFQATDVVVGFITSSGYTLQPSGYSVTNVDNNGGGNVVFSTPPPSLTTIDIRSFTPQTQGTNFANLGAYLPENSTEAMDRVTRVVQDLTRLTYTFGIHGPDQEGAPWPALPIAAARANTGLVFDSNGLPSIGTLLPTALTQALFNVFLSQSWSAFAPYMVTPAENAAAVSVANITYLPGDVRRYPGGDSTGVFPSDAAWASAVAQAAQGGAEIMAPGTYLVATGIVVTGSGTKLRGGGMGLTRLKAGASGIIVLKIAASNCTVDSLLIDGNGNSNVDGLVVGPANESITTATSQVNFNNFYNIQTQNCNNGLRMLAGPSVSGIDSGCFYNQFYGCFWLNCIRGVWMQNSVNSGNGAPNRGSFHGCRVGSAGVVSNTGLQIDAGGTNQFFGMHFEGIANGILPSTIPTGVVIAEVASSGLDNNDNQFFGCMNEANTQDLNNQNTFTEIIGGVWTATKFASGNVNPIQMVGGTDASLMPTIIEGMMHGEGVPGYPSGVWGMTKEISDWNPTTLTSYQWQAYALSTASNVSGMASIAAGAASQYRQQSNMVDWHFTCAFDASTGGSQILITPPITPNASLYTTLQTSNAFFTFYVNNGSGLVQTSGGFTNAGKLFINAPSGSWNTSGNNNALFCEVRYHI